MSKWIAEFELEDGDTMPEHMDLNYMGAKIDFHCRPMWIPVSERLPEEGITVIGINLFGDIYKSECYNDCGEIKWYADGDYDVPIVAWMPLPEPYKGKEEEE